MIQSNTIESLVADLAPVRRVRARSGLMAVLGATALAILAVFTMFGFRPDIVAGEPHPMVMMRGGMLALLGLAATVAAIAAARPAVGQGQNGWLWALAAAALAPITAIVLFVWHMMSGLPFGTGAMDFHYAPYCVGTSLSSALLIGAALTLWLRGGAPTALNRAGWLVGLAAGGFGTFAYSLHCPSESIYYIGLWYTVSVTLCATIGRLIVPPLIRW